MNFLDSIKNIDLGVSARHLMNATSNFVRRDALTVFATSKVAIGVFVGVALLAGLTLYYCTRKVKPVSEKKPQQIDKSRDTKENKQGTRIEHNKRMKLQTSRLANKAIRKH